MSASPKPRQLDGITFHALTEDQLQQWFDHVDTVFETTPRLYFENHYFKDPWKDIKSIQVAVDKQSQQIVSTIKVCTRFIFINGKQYKMGGIAEVSTKKEFRGRGLAAELLDMCMEYMKKNSFEISFLHSSAAAGYYATLQWISCPLHHLHKHVSQFPTSVEVPAGHVIRAASPADYDAIAPVQQTYSQRFSGTLVRNKEYWSNWVATESANRHMYVLLDSAQAVRAYIIMGSKRRQEQLMVFDFAVDQETFHADRGSKFFHTLVAHVLQQQQQQQQQQTPVQYVSYPAPLFGENFSALPHLDDALKNPESFAMATHHDVGFMYKLVHRGNDTEVAQLGNEMTELAKSKQAVFWPIDGY